MRRAVTASLIAALFLSPLSVGAAAVPQLRLSLSAHQQRSASATSWRIPVLQFDVSTRKPADVRSLFFAVEGRSRRGKALEGAFTSVLDQAELYQASTGRKVQAIIADERVRDASRFVALRFDDVIMEDNQQWQLRLRLKGSKRIDWLRATICGSMAEGTAPCVSADGGSQFQPWVQDLQSGDDIAVSPTMLEGRPVVVRGVK